MAKSTNVYSIQSVNNLSGQLTSSTGANTLVTVWTAGANDGVLKSFGVTSTDTAARILQVFINIGGGGTDLLAGSVKIPIASGSDGATAAVDVLRSALVSWLSCDAYGNKVFNAEAGTTIKVSTTTAITSAKTIQMLGEGGDF